ncbi:MAG TPA: HIT domain-containing protein [Anaerolineales bacterium]|nr:HIT domain-containing protein [Anaerolineales bacterium]
MGIPAESSQVDVRKWLWKPAITRLIGWMFEHMSFAIPVKRLRETETLMAFYHPKPSYPFHVLLLPKKAVVSLKEFDPADTAFLTDLYATVQSLVNEFQLPAYRLIVNGGEFQDFPQLHFHLVSNVGTQRDG